MVPPSDPSDRSRLLTQVQQVRLTRGQYERLRDVAAELQLRGVGPLIRLIVQGWLADASTEDELLEMAEGLVEVERQEREDA